MIASVNGRVLQVSLTSAVVNVGGVGLDVLCSPGTLAGLRVGAEASLPTSLVVREDSLTLYGFADEAEKATFEIAQTASGVGPKVAQALVAVLKPEEFHAAVAHDDVKALTAVPGIGQKGAQRIILELKDRLGPIAPAAAVSRTAPAPWKSQVHEGLVGLGWSGKEADKALAVVADSEDAHVDDPDVGALLRAALRTLSKA